MSAEPRVPPPGGEPGGSGGPDPARGTKQRLLDAAEHLFAERGFEGVSMRALTQEAGTSVSAANYHFGSKQDLLAAVLRRTIQPINERRLALLDALERPLEVEAVLEAFVRPTFEALAASPEASARFRSVAARLFSDPRDVVSALHHDLFEAISERFIEALAETLPGRALEEVRIGFQLVVGTMVHVISGNLDATRERTGHDHDEILALLVAHSAAGLRSLPASGPDARRGRGR